MAQNSRLAGFSQRQALGKPQLAQRSHWEKRNDAMKQSTTSLALLGCATLASLLGACASSAPQSSAATLQTEGSPFATTYKPPCTAFDDDEWFVAMGVANGSKRRMDALQQAAINNAQNVIRQKMMHAYQGMVSNYTSSIGNNQGSDLVSKMEMGGNQIIDRIVNDTRVVCGPEYTAPDESGYVQAFVGIKISKASAASQAATAVANNLTPEEKLQIGFQEQQFAEKTKAAFAAYKAANNPQ
jgi:hypothetical protein